MASVFWDVLYVGEFYFLFHAFGFLTNFCSFCITLRSVNIPTLGKTCIMAQLLSSIYKSRRKLKIPIVRIWPLLYFSFLFFFFDWAKTYNIIQANRAIITVRYITEVFWFLAITETIYSSIICKSADVLLAYIKQSYWLMSLIYRLMLCQHEFI